MKFILTTAALALAGVLLWAGVEKLRHLPATMATISRLGLPHRFSQFAALLVATAEITVAFAVLFRPDSALTQSAIVLLAALFALAGLRALSFEEPILCNCFGAGGVSYLGKAQLVGFFLWLGGAGILRFGIQESPSLQTAAAYFAITSLSLASVKAIAIWKARRQARADRLSATEMYAWLRSY